MLELLCHRRGEVVSQDQLVDEIWGGRALSQNSVAVVIGDLRRALDDDARRPRYIETVSKRGYRLIASGGEAPRAPMAQRRRLIGWAAAVVLLLFAVAALAWVRLGPQHAPPALLVVEEIINATGDPAHDAVARSVTEVILAELGQMDGLRVARTTTEGPAATLSGRLVIWTGQPALGLSATDPVTGQILWSGMARGPEPALPDQIRAEMPRLAAALVATGRPLQPQSPEGPSGRASNSARAMDQY